MLAAITHFKQ